MCKPGEPCNQAKAATKTPITQEFMGRLEMMIVMSELHEAHEVDMPKGALAMIDVIGPMLMDHLRKAKGWSQLQMATAILKQKNRLYEQQGMPVPDAHPLEMFFEMLAEIKDEVDKRERADANGAKDAAPASPDDHGTIHMFVMRGKGE